MAALARGKMVKDLVMAWPRNKGQLNIISFCLCLIKFWLVVITQVKGDESIPILSSNRDFWENIIIVFSYFSDIIFCMVMKMLNCLSTVCYTSHNGLPCGINLQVPKLCRVGNILVHLRLLSLFCWDTSAIFLHVSCLDKLSWPHVSSTDRLFCLYDPKCKRISTGWYMLYLYILIQSSLSYRIIDSKIRKSHETKQTNECEIIDSFP